MRVRAGLRILPALIAHLRLEAPLLEELQLPRDDLDAREVAGVDLVVAAECLQGPARGLVCHRHLVRGLQLRHAEPFGAPGHGRPGMLGHVA
eukprot:2290897-Lingulodinium_polyedra.AAC.1